MSEAVRRKLRCGMVGGGEGAFIGPVHRTAMAMEGRIDLAAGCFSRVRETGLETGRMLRLDESRCYASFADMAAGECRLSPDRRIDFVAIVTPTVSHYEVARTFLSAGFHVVCDKPMTYSLEQALALERLVEQTGLVFCVTHNYTGYPMVRECRELVRSGAIGVVRRVMVEYLQDFLGLPTAADDSQWRLDPRQVGIAGTLCEAGVHCASLLEFVIGEQIEQVCMDRKTFLPGRLLEEDAGGLLRLSGGGRGSLTVSQIATGEDNNLTLRIYGSEGAVRWSQESPDHLDLLRFGAPRQILSRGRREYLSAAANRSAWLPPGHPEGFLEAFANIYRGFADAVYADLAGERATGSGYDYPTARDGVRTMAFVDAAVRSADSESRWTDV